MENKFDPDQILRASVSMVAGNLTNEELAAINNVTQIGADPRKVAGYEKVQHLFTEKSAIEDPFTHEKKMIPVAHTAVREALANMVLKRLPPINPQ